MTNEETILNNTEEILRILRNQDNTEENETPVNTDFSNELQQKIDTGILYNELKDYIIEQLTQNGIYTQALFHLYFLLYFPSLFNFKFKI